MNRRVKIWDDAVGLRDNLPRDCKIVFTNGCFDILHLGHIDLLSKAKQFGDVLIVGINTDDSIRRLKSEID